MAAILVGRTYDCLGISFTDQWNHYVTAHEKPIAGKTVPEAVVRFLSSVVFTAPAAFALHWIVHCLVMKVVVRQALNVNKGVNRGSTSDELRQNSPRKVSELQIQQQQCSYHDFIKGQPISYFNTNPVHCLRSKFIFKEEPPVFLHTYGKEYLQMGSFEKMLEAYKNLEESLGENSDVAPQPWSPKRQTYRVDELLKWM